MKTIIQLLALTASIGIGGATSYSLPATSSSACTLSAPTSESSPGTVYGSWEAESGYATNSTLGEDPTASGGEYVALGEGGNLWLEVESESEQESVMINYRSPDVDRMIDVFIDTAFAGSFVCRASVDGKWDSIQLDTPFAGTGFHMVQISLTSESTTGCCVDVLNVCKVTMVEPCPGCQVGPLLPPKVTIDPIPVLIPTIDLPIIGWITEQVASLVEVEGIKIVSVTPTAERGECELQPDPEKPCGKKLCKEKKGCSIKIVIVFKAIKYIGPQFWDVNEEVTLPSGAEKAFVRAANNHTVQDTVSIKCGQTPDVTFKFEHGEVQQRVVCEFCQDTVAQ